MASIAEATIAALQEHISQYPSIKLFTPENSDFENVQSCFVRRPARPIAVVRPQTAEDVQALIQFCVHNNVEFVIRGGGHDCAGRSQVYQALTIDMRDIQYVHISKDKTTASVGGGILIRDFTRILGEQGLVTPVGTIATVGYTGWATLGGYGPFSTSHGVGADQIVAAKLVNSKAEIVEANEELLRGMRGGGGIFGVIVELTVKVYPLKEILASTLVFESNNLQAAWATYAKGFEDLLAKEGLPRALQLQPFGIEFPGLGKVLAIGASWTSDDQGEGLRWIDKIASLGNCALKLTKSTSLTAYCEDNEKLVVWGSYGRTHTVSFKNYTPKTAQILAKYAELLPGGSPSFGIHMLRASVASTESVFGSRVQHHMLEIVSLTPDVAMEEKAAAWALSFKKELRENDPDNVLDSSYVALLDDDDADWKKIYGSHYETLLGLKRKYDPDNVFKHAIPKLHT
ncbi:FAD-binding domain-containing protein [Whalleya microplaca]|nr:FAD-binding domain-containing protein [Whalleya microplaca]